MPTNTNLPSALILSGQNGLVLDGRLSDLETNDQQKKVGLSEYLTSAGTNDRQTTIQLDE